MIRTIKNAVEEIKKIDNNSDITVYAIRKMIKEGKIPYIKTGNKVLINVENIIAYINGDLKMS